MFIGLMGVTHALLAIAGTTFALGDSSLVVIILSIIGSQIPDIDTTKSTISKIFPINLIAAWIEARYPHRSVTHSLLFTIALLGVSGIPYILGIHHSWKYWLALPVAHLFSCIGDQMTKEGVAALWPNPARVVFVENPHRRITTGTPPEYWLVVFCTAIAILVFNINTAGGMTASVGQMMGSQERAIAVYNEQGSNHHIWVNIEGVRASDRAKIDGRYLLVAQPSKGKFVLQNQTGLYATGEQILPNKMKAEAGTEAQIKEQAIAFFDEPLAKDESSKLWRFYKANEGAAIYLSGSLEISDPELIIPIIKAEEDPKKMSTISISGNSLNLNYANVVKIGKMVGNQWATGSLTARIIYPKPTWTQ